MSSDAARKIIFLRYQFSAVNLLANERTSVNALNESGEILFVLVINDKDLQNRQDATVLQDCDKVMIIFNFNFTSLFQPYNRSADIAMFIKP